MLDTLIEEYSIVEPDTLIEFAPYHSAHRDCEREFERAYDN